MYPNMLIKFFGAIYCVTTIFAFINCSKFPNQVEQCIPGDTDCIMNVANNLLHERFTGLAALNLVSLDPLEIPAIHLKQGADSPVNIKLDFTNVELIGLKDCSVYKISGFGNELTDKYEIRTKGPVFSLVGPYKITGRVLILPIQGDGISNITLVNPDLLFKFTGKAINRNGKEYLNIEDAKLTFLTTRVYMHFDNLYNGDKALGDNTNIFLNENWNEIFDEIKASVFDAFTLIFQGLLNNIFTKFPYKEIFAKQ